MDRITSGPRVLTVEEKQEFHRDMQESSTQAKAEQKRRRAAKNQKILSMVQMMVSRKDAFITICYLCVFSYH